MSVERRFSTRQFRSALIEGSLQFGSDLRPHTAAITWHAWESMRSLEARGLDPLRLLIDRARAKGMAFWADLRLSTYGGMPAAYKVADGGTGWANPEVRPWIR